MKWAYNNIGHILNFDEVSVKELVVENKRLFFQMVNSMALQVEGMPGDCILSKANKPIEFAKYADLTVQFAPFQLNRKTLLSKLYTALEKQTLVSENYYKTAELLSWLERYVLQLAEDFPFDIHCQKLVIGPIIRALAPEVDESNHSPLEKVFAYMELVRELDRDKLFIMVNMRSYFSDDEMDCFSESAVLHDFKVLLLENTEFPQLRYAERYIIDNDLCEF